MASPVRFYLSHMHDKTKYRATWDPTRQLRVGDIGKLDQGVLNIYCTLKKQNIPVEISTGNSGTSMNYTAHDCVHQQAKMAGDSPLADSMLGRPDAGFRFDFNGNRGIVFQTGNHRVHQLTNLGAIEDQVLHQYHTGNWNRHWVIVTEVIEADTATIIVSDGNRGILELKANNIPVPGTLILTDAGLNLSVLRETSSTLKCIAQQGLTPLYRVMGLRSAFLNGIAMGTKTIPDREPLQERLEILDYHEAEVG